MSSSDADVHFDAASGAWHISGHADCIAVLRDDSFSAALGQRKRHRTDRLPTSMLNVDPPAHRRLRAAAGPLVASAQVQRCRTQVGAAARHFAASAAARGAFDGIAHYAAPVAAVALATLLGVPAGEVRTFSRLARDAAANLNPLADDAVASFGRQAADELVDFLEAMIVERRVTPGGGIAALMEEAEPASAGGRSIPLTLDETLATLVLVVVGGFEPLMHLIGNGLHTVLRTEEAAGALRQDPTLWPTAIDEFLRVESPIPFTARVCTRTARLAGQRIEPGDLVVTWLSRANRDPTVYADPDSVHIGRKENSMLAFGTGTHVCLGGSFARTVGRVALETALDEMTQIRLLDESPAWMDRPVPHGLAQLPLEVK